MAKKQKEQEKQKAQKSPSAPEPETAAPAPVEEPRQATVAHTNVMRFHKTEKPRIFTKGETIPADWYDNPKGMRQE